MLWFRWYHGTVADPKMGSLARKAGTTRERVVAVWAMLLESASDAEDRGRFTVDADGIADCLNCDTESISAILAAMSTVKMIKGNQVVAFEGRNPPRDDSSQRVKKHRQRKRSNAGVTVTRRDVTPPEIDREIDEEEETTPSSNLSARVASLDEEERTSLVIRLANRGMCDNPYVDQERLRPILPQNGFSRQAVADWRAAGIDWPTIEATVYDRATKYKPEPNGRYKQIDRLTYFTPAVMEAHEKRAAMDVAPPELPTQEQMEQAAPAMASDPVTQEWATAMDAQLRAAIDSDEVLRYEVEKVRNNLRRLNAEDRDFKRMGTPQQEAYLWIRVLNWYGERTGSPRPTRNRPAA